MRSLDKRVRRLIRHAYANVPYYTQHFDMHRIRPEDIRSVADLAMIPVSSKQDLQRDASAFLARGSETASLIRHTTSGSTGQPVAILNSVAEQHEVNVGRWRLAYYYGTRPGARAAWVAITRPSLQLERRMLKALTASRLYRQRRISCLLPPQEILRQLREFSPSSINGFPGVLAQVAQFAIETGCTDLRPKYVGVGGEVLTPAMRKNIGAAFDAPVYDVYASHELGVTAYQCRSGQAYHVRDDAVVAEIVADGKAVGVGESGDLIGTNLNAFTMPFIRYVIGDVVTRGPDSCACGASSPTLMAIEGRALDYFRLPDGRTLHPFSFNLGLTPWIRNFSMVQERSDLITAYVVASSERTGDQVSELESSVRRVLGPRVSFRMQFVDAITPSPSGKFRPYRGLAPQGSGGDRRVRMSGIVDEMARSPGLNVFVHGVTSIGNLAGVNLNDDESHRALLFARQHDIVVVPTAVDGDFLAYIGSLGLEIPAGRIVVASDGVEPAASGSLAETLMSNHAALDTIATLCGDAPVTLSPFIATEVEWRLTASLEALLGRPVRVLGATAALVRSANMKHVIRARAEANGVPVTPAELVRPQLSAAGSADLAAAIGRTLGVTGRVVVKGSFGASGSSTFVVETEADIAGCVGAVTDRHDNDVYIVEPLYDIVCSPNIVMWIDSGGGDVSCVSVNDQCIDRRLVFAGSTYPSVASLLPGMIEAASVLTRTLQDEGFSGAAGFDFCEYEDPVTGTRSFFLSELNARINGGMYATVLMERLNRAQARRSLPSVSALRSTSVFSSPTTFAAVRDRCRELMFNPLTGVGVVPFNPGRLAAGKIALACFGDSPGQVEELHSECRDRLG